MSGRADRRRVDGILLLDKPAGISSNAALQRAKRALGALKAGHTGTLDPLATGLLPIAFGEATKFAQPLLDARKAYVAVVRFGTATSTGDAEGEVVERGPVPPDRAAVARCLPALTGPIRQVPPRYAALKHRGRAYYEWAREGVDIERTPREIVVHRLELADWAPPDATLVVDCSKGTYVRVLAADVGAALGTLATLASLRRTRFGAFDVAEARPLQELLDLPGIEDLPLIPSRAALRGVREMPVDPPLAFAIASGQRTALREVSPPLDDERLLALIAPNRELLAVLEADSGSWRLKRVLMPEAGQLYRP